MNLSSLPRIPVDIAIYGGSTAAMAAALRLKERGFSVAVISHRTFLGEDICDSLRLRPPTDFDCGDPLVGRIYGSQSEPPRFVRPMQIKGALDQLLLEADIPVMLGSFVTSVLTDENGTLAGLALMNRSGQAVISCRAVLDGSFRGELARLSQVPLTPPAASFSVIRRVLGGEAVAETDAEWRAEGGITLPQDDTETTETLWANESVARLADGSWSAWMALEQSVRCGAYRRGQSFSADSIFALTGERLHPGQSPVEAAGDLSRIPARAASAHNQRMWFSGPVVNVDDKTRERLIRHEGAIQWGHHLAERITEHLHGQDSPGDPKHAMPGTELREEVDVLVVAAAAGVAGFRTRPVRQP
jgi:hypothetical protein